MLCIVAIVAVHYTHSNTCYVVAIVAVQYTHSHTCYVLLLLLLYTTHIATHATVDGMGCATVDGME